MKIFYFPLEPYKERYTVQLSASKKGWLESRWIEAKQPYTRIEGVSQQKENKINAGVVLDATNRGKWACNQIANFLSEVEKNNVSKEDVLYFDDFWHPGICAIPYAFHFIYKNQKPKMYAMLHAQSVDIYDFTYPMREWMRYFEIGIGKILSGIFVTSTSLRDLCLYAGIGTSDNVRVFGLPYNSGEVKTHFPEKLPKKKRQVIYSSRWDKEKKPDIFLAIAKKVYEIDKTIKFVVTTSFDDIKSNDQNLIKALNEYKYDNLEIKTNQTKEQYYYNLLESSIQINTADQDFVSWTLLESTTCGCRPLYPYYLSFPECLDYKSELMYEKNDVHHASNKIIKYIDCQVNDPVDYSWIYKLFDSSWLRMLNFMKGIQSEEIYNR